MLGMPVAYKPIGEKTQTKAGRPRRSTSVNATSQKENVFVFLQICLHLRIHGLLRYYADIVKLCLSFEDIAAHSLMICLM